MQAISFGPQIVPLRKATRRDRMPPKVLFPAPLGPTTAQFSPRAIAQDMGTEKRNGGRIGTASLISISKFCPVMFFSLVGGKSTKIRRKVSCFTGDKIGAGCPAGNVAGDGVWSRPKPKTGNGRYRAAWFVRRCVLRLWQGRRYRLSGRFRGLGSPRRLAGSGYCLLYTSWEVT